MAGAQEEPTAQSIARKQRGHTGRSWSRIIPTKGIFSTTQGLATWFFLLDLHSTPSWHLSGTRIFNHRL